MNHQTPTVLVASYDPNVRATITSALNRERRCRILAAASGTDVFEAVVSAPPHAVVIDATRDDTLALATLHRLRRHGERPVLPVALLSNEEHSPERSTRYSSFDIAGVITTWRDRDLADRVEAVTGLDLAGGPARSTQVAAAVAAMPRNDEQRRPIEEFDTLVERLQAMLDEDVAASLLDDLARVLDRLGRPTEAAGARAIGAELRAVCGGGTDIRPETIVSELLQVRAQLAA